MINQINIKKAGYKLIKRSKPFYYLAMVLLIFINENLGAQTRNYLKGPITGNRQDGGLLGYGDSVGISNPVLKHTYSGVFRYFYGNNILNDTSTLFARVTATRDVAADLIGLPITAIGGNAYIQFRNTSTIPAGTAVYFKHGNYPTGTGISLPAGGLLSLGINTPFEGSLYTGAGNYTFYDFLVTGTPNEGSIISGTFTTNLLLDKDGVIYSSITPSNKTSSFNSVRFKLQIPADLLGLGVLNKSSINIYNAFYITPSSNICSILPMFTTRGEVNGISLDVGSVLSTLDLSELIANPQYAIDGLETTYSAFKSGLVDLGVLSSVTQSFIFDHTASSSDGLRLQVSVPSSLLSVDLLNGLYIDFYRNDTLQTSKQLGSSFIALDLLTLPVLAGGYSSINTVINPAISFDKARLRLASSILSVDLLGDGIRVHEVSLAPAVPIVTTNPANDTVCSGEPASFLAAASGASSYSWEYYTGSSWTSTGATAATLNISTTSVSMDNRQYRVKVTGSGSCPQTITSHTALLKVKTRPSAPIVLLSP